MSERKLPVYQSPPTKTVAEAGSGRFVAQAIGNIIDGGLFFVAVVATFAITWVIIQASYRSWVALALYFIPIWVIIAYLALPRVHSMLTSIYVPHYFIGRTRTGDGLLGDPVNLALDGDAEQIHQAMAEAGWVLADPIDLRSTWRIIWGSLSRRSYPEAPVSPLYLFDRKQDFAYQQEVEGNPAQRHHVRFWKCPEGWLLPGGARVDWLAAGTYDRSVGFSLFTLQVTHKIDANIDIERDFIVDSVLYANPAVKVRVLRGFSTGYHSRNGGGDVITTDGDLPVLELGAVPAVALTPASKPLDRLHAAAESVGRRPVSVVLGVALTLLIFVGELWSAVSYAVASIPSVAEIGDPLVAAVTQTVMVGLILLLAAVNLWFAWRTFKGRAWVRRWLVALTALGVFLELPSLLGLSPDHFLASLLHAMLGVLVVYALTSTSAQEWEGTQRTREIRRGGIPASASGAQQ